MIETTMNELGGFRVGQNSFNDYIGIQDVRIDDDGNYYLVMTVTDVMLNPYGTVHGGVLFALCDSAVGSYLHSNHLPCVTLSSTINFYQPARVGDVLTAHVLERNMGKTVKVVTVEVRNQEGIMIAECIFHMYRVFREKPDSK